MNLTRCTYKDLKEFVSTNRERVLEWALAIQKIKNEGWWREDCKTWQEWCDQYCGKSASAIRKIIWTGEARKLIETTTGEKPKPETVLREQANTSEQKSERKPSDMSAKLDKEAPPPEIHKPPEMPRTQQLSVGDKLAAIERDLDRLSHKQLEYEIMKLVCRVLCEVKEVRVMLQPALPLEVESSKKGSKGSQFEVTTYCKLIGLTQADGDWFFDKCQGCGWKNNGKPILDWQATVRAWKAQLIFPSQKQHSTYGSQTYRGGSPPNSRNEGTTPRPETQPDYGEAARRKQELQRANAARH